jgi:branched-chain amino acid transport system permease protein
MPLWITDGYVLQLIFRVVIFAVVGMAWNIVGGYAGQLSLGHVAYFGIGAYAMTLSTERIGWNPWLGVTLGVILAAIGALIIGSITFRLRGPYFALSACWCRTRTS